MYTTCKLNESLKDMHDDALPAELVINYEKGSPIIPIVSRINPIPRIDSYFFRSILIWSSHLRLGLFNHHDYIRWWNNSKLENNPTVLPGMNSGPLDQ